MNTLNETHRRILVIDDEAPIRLLLKTALAQAGFEACEASDGKDGIAQAIAKRPDIVLLDLGLPDMDGIEVLKKLREWYRHPILILSVRDQEQTIVTALDGGADDYLCKPFNVNELLARIRVADRNYQKDKGGPRIQVGEISIDLSRHRVERGGQEIKLTATEYDVLKVLAQNRGRILTHRQLLHEIWGPNSSEHIQYLRVYIGHLRQKLEANPNNPQLILTEPGIGYRLTAD